MKNETRIWIARAIGSTLLVFVLLLPPSQVVVRLLESKILILFSSMQLNTQLTNPFTAKEQLAKRVLELEMQNRELRQTNIQLSTLQEENNQLRQQLASVSAFTTGHFLSATLTSVNAKGIILAGSDQGVFVGQQVVSLGALIGKIREVDVNMSSVDLVASPQNPMLIQHLATKQKALLNQENGKLVAHFTGIVTLQPGDTLMSVPTANGERSLPIGTVEKVISSLADPVTEITVKAFEPMPDSRIVLLYFPS